VNGLMAVRFGPGSNISSNRSVPASHVESHDLNVRPVFANARPLEAVTIGPSSERQSRHDQMDAPPIADGEQQLGPGVLIEPWLAGVGDVRRVDVAPVDGHKRGVAFTDGEEPLNSRPEATVGDLVDAPERQGQMEPELQLQEGLVRPDARELHARFTEATSTGDDLRVGGRSRLMADLAHG
jgi:hypothetical protein